MPITDTARGTNNIQSKQVVVDMSEKIVLLQPKAAPLLVLTKKLATDPCFNYKYEWMDDDILGSWATFTAATEGAPGTDLTVDDSSVFAVNDLVKVPRTSEVMKVTAVPSSTHITVTRGYGETVAAVINNNEKLLCIGNASMQGSGAGPEKYNLEAPAYNYTQIFKTAFSVTNTLNAMKLYGGKKLAQLRAKKGIEHARSIEYALMFGERKLDVAGGQPVTTTAGVVKFLQGTDNVTTKSLATIVEKDVLDWCEELFKYGSDQRLFLCSPSWLSLFSTWAEGKLQVEQGETTFGLSIMRYHTPHGDLLLTRHPLFVEGYSGYGIALDMAQLKYRPLEGRDTKFQTNIQNNDEDGERDQYITETGLELRQPKMHGMFILS